MGGGELELSVAHAQSVVSCVSCSAVVPAVADSIAVVARVHLYCSVCCYS